MYHNKANGKFLGVGIFNRKLRLKIRGGYVGNLGPPRNFLLTQKYTCLGIFHSHTL